jgi:hypothetical protein
MTRLLRIAFWIASAFAFTMAILPEPVELPASDKVWHMTAFFVITLLGRAAYPHLSRKKLLPALVAFGGIIELAQLIPELHRDAEWSDWLADSVAITAALACGHWVERWRAARSGQPGR